MTILSTFGCGSSGVDTGDIPASLRVRRGASSYASTVFATPTSDKKCLISCWVKDTALSSGLIDFTFLGQSGNVNNFVVISGTGALGATYNSRLTCRFGGTTKDYWTPLWRDPSGFTHFVISFDTTQATQADRAKAWANGVELPKGASALGLNEVLPFATAGNQVALSTNVSGYYSDGYAARFAFLDGKCIQDGSASLSSFGYLNTEINEWVTKSQSAVKAVVDAGGTNSFMLDFDDGTSLTTLGYDKSSKGNNWTLNNFSLTAGTTYDHMLDVPGNSFATLNNIYPSAANITNGNLTSGTTAVRATMNALAFDSKWEVTAGGSAVTAGVISATGTTNTTSVTANKVFAFRLTTAGALDYRNVTDAGSWTSITTGLSGEQYPYGVTQAANWNFGQAPLHASATYQFAAGGYFYDTTSGYKALCQRNMPDPAILNPENHFDVVTYTGTAATKSITGLLFSPGLIEMKSRGRALDWAYYDSVRGVEKRLESNNTDAEVTGDTTGLTAFNSDGWTMGALDQINGTTATNSFVGSAWKAGGAPVTNNAGSISSQVSANVEAGFSIVTYTGTGANATVGHGLGKAPGLILNFRRGPTGANHFVYHSKVNGGVTPANYYLLLSGTGAQTADALVWNNTVPTSSVFSLGSTGEVNFNTGTFVAYCFAEIEGFSKIFSYTGNGSADGPFVHCGFKPKYVLVKCSSSTGTWRIYDASRPGYNVIGGTLQAESSGVETTAAEVDFTATGFKLRVATDPNTAQTYIGIAFADVAGKFALGR